MLFICRYKIEAIWFMAP